MIAYCFFSYGLDQDCLAQAIRSIRLCDPTAKIAVFDDATAPMPSPPDCDHYEQTSFDRCGNLNGRECIVGEITCFSLAAALFGVSHVAKVDCDTVVLRPPVPMADLTGASWHQKSVWGPFYLLATHLLPRMAELAPTQWPLWAEEDMAITAIARAAGGSVKILEWKDGWLNGLDYRLRAFDMERFRIPGAVTCGNRMHLSGDDQHAIVARAMWALLDYLYEGRPFDWPFVMGDVPDSPPAAVAVPSVAVIVIGWNTAAYVAQCLDSIFTQTHQIDDVIYVDDASTDGSVAIAETYRERGLKILSLPENGGMNKARMAGVALTAAQLLLFVDSDNELPANYLATMIEDIEGNDFVYPSKKFFGEEPSLIHRRQWHPDDKWEPCQADRAELWRQNYADTCSLVRRDAFMAAGAWRENPADTMADWELFLRMSGLGPHSKSRARLNYRVHVGNWSERERGNRIRLNGLVRRHAARVTVACVWSGRMPEMAEAWIAAILGSLQAAGKVCHELLIMDDSENGWQAMTGLPLPTGNDLLNVHVRRIHRGLTTDHRRPDRAATAAFLAATCNEILRVATGDIIWCIEDDVVVPAHAADVLLHELLQASDAPHTAVAGCYKSRHGDDEWIACNVVGDRVVHLKTLPTQVSPIQMTGTGCMMILKDLLKGVRFGTEWRHANMRSTGHDWVFAWDLYQRGTPVRLVPSVICRHHSSQTVWV